MNEFYTGLQQKTKAVLLLYFYMFHGVECLRRLRIACEYIFSLVQVTKWVPLEKQPLTQLTVCTDITELQQSTVAVSIPYARRCRHVPKADVLLKEFICQVLYLHQQFTFCQVNGTWVYIN